MFEIWAALSHSWTWYAAIAALETHRTLSVHEPVGRKRLRTHQRTQRAWHISKSAVKQRRIRESADLARYLDPICGNHSFQDSPDVVSP
jgi:hypothetical protein